MSRITANLAWTSHDWERVGKQGGAAIAIAVVVTLVGRRYVHSARRRAETRPDESGGRRHRRTATVTGLVVGTAQVLVWFAALLVIIGAVGVRVGPLIASAGIVGVALGFGAQTLVKDTLAGLFIALEGQFDVGDTVDLQSDGGVVSGTIEGLSLRVTTVRQFDGALSIVPNGSIHVTSNKTRGWGRAIVDVRVALDEDPERVRDLLEELFDGLIDEPPFDVWLRDRPKVLGVTQLTDVAQVIRVAAETQPNHRLDAERRLRALISARVTERGVRSPPVMVSAPRSSQP
ncbi:MAG: moderate conductance mechanosensitive channel [Actinomycetota bacterium]|jgi:small conductance mechanosensitive channel|nr:moderate conductance mechanosensitive channel [Actinomycetota bacterium]